MRDLDVLTVELKGKNLIEASAGTGKTYSIGILVIRLLIENKLNINEILMVTFTKSAVEELKSRVSEFCRNAKKFLDEYIQGNQIIGKNEDPIKKYINSYCESHKNELPNLQKRIHANILLLDELNVMTIHGFCQKSLNEFAFESNQLFGAELIQDTQPIIENALNEFWRKHISTLNIEILQNIDYKIVRNDILNIVNKQIEGKKYAFYDESIDYAEKFATSNFEDYKAEVQNNYDLSFNYLFKLLNNNILRNLLEKISGSNALKKSFLSVTDPLAFISLCLGSSGWKSNAVTRTFSDEIWWHIKNLQNLSQNLDAEASRLYRQNLYCWAIQDITYKYENVLVSNSLLSYNDLISNMSKAVSKSERLVKQLQNKYHAIFVDEFQDTDSEQYNIFQTTFGYDDSIMFLIGDPKQSIYAWRKADLDTYFLAKSNVGENIFSMKTNHRSGANVIQDFNRFFLPKNDFDTFYFPDKNAKNSIEYIEVGFATKNSEVGIYQNDKIENGLQIWQGKNKESISNKTVQLTLDLLTNKDLKIDIIEDKKFVSRRIEPKDIGIIVRSNATGLSLKKELSRLGIPCVMLFEQKVLQSEEASSLYFLLEAILNPKIANILKVLKSNILNYSNEDILRLDKEDLVQHFYNYKKSWMEKGIYPTIQSFFIQFDVEKQLQIKNGSDRIWANTTQIAEILNKTEQKQNLKEEELLSWLKKRIDGLDEEGDEYLMRIESDENAVTIITIHKSKGLEYNIVICPELDFSDDSRDTFISYKDEDSGDFITKDKTLATEQELAYISTELERENRRLIYVALTRAVAQCHILSTNKKENAISCFYKNLNTQYFNIQEIEEIDLYKLTKYSKNITDASTETYVDHWIDLNKYNDAPWIKLSYTALAAHGEIIPKERSNEFQNKYDEFIFSKLRFGALSGNLLHDILEKIDFEDARGVYNDKVLKDTIHSYLPQSNEEFFQNIQHLIKNILNANIIIENQLIKLNKIRKEKHLSELEFDFPIHRFATQNIIQFANESRNIQIKNPSNYEIEGMMNGKIDLLFEYEGKYYILDWKSNYLGYRLEDYTSENVALAMNENNYHLQYMIYAVALKKYLKSRGLDFEKCFGGVAYLFIRGIRSEMETGIFTYLPQIAEIELLENILSKK